MNKLIGGILLVAGCCVGAGMLGLPVATAPAGFFPSVVFFILSWLFMAITGLLVLEVNLWFGGQANVMTMAEGTIGKVGKYLGAGLFLFLFYCLMVAYTSGMGALVVDFIEQYTGTLLPIWVGSLILAAILGVFLYAGTRAVDKTNQLLMLGLGLTYVLLVAMGGRHVNTANLMHVDLKASAFILPTMIVSFGYHNLIPSLNSYFKGDVKALRKVILIGSSLPLLVYLIWDWVILGIIPLNEFEEALDSGEMVTRTLKQVVGSGYIVDVAQYFAFFAVVTSFLAVALSFVDFLADALSVEKDPKGNILLCSLVLVPPFIFSILHPNVFLSALSYAGAYGAVVLFGILPALMVWSGRYRQNRDSVYTVPGGKGLLIGVIAFSLFVFVMQLIQDL